MSFLAKCNPDQSYEQHVWWVYQSWTKLVEQHSGLIGRICKQYDMERSRFLLSSLLTVALHDMGKLSLNFQRIMKASSEGERWKAIKQNFRHEYASVAFVRNGALSLARERELLLPSEPHAPLEVMAVLGHHKTVDGQLNRFEREQRNPEALEWAPGGIEEGLRVAEKIFSDYGESLPGLDVERCKKWVRKVPQYVRELSQRVKDPATMREVFILLKGLLMTSDWHASAHVLDYPSTVQVESGMVREYLEEKGKKEGWIFADFRNFQSTCGKVDGHVVAVAPTGSGKTEAALLWALRQAEKKQIGKIIYLLPTMVTANSLHRRMQQFFSAHKHPVGLSHSLADLVTRQEQERMEDLVGGGGEDLRSRLLFDRHFLPPVTVGTVDQLLTTLFHSGRWPLKSFAAQDAAIVLDEIHSYDPYTTGLIFKAVAQLGATGARFMIMSATLPESLVRDLTGLLERSGHVEVVRDQELLQASRSLFRVVDGDLFSHLDEIRETVENGKRVLIVVNTVGRCQELVKKLADLEPVCYHSKFILKDRQEKERLILEERPALVVATQVVEVALDIDFDVLFTECAPPDALAQRAGRINRRREREGEVVIFRPGPSSEKIYYDDTRTEQPEEERLLNRSFRMFAEVSGQRLTEQDLLDLVEQIYIGREVQSHPDFGWAQQCVTREQERFFGMLDPIHGEDERIPTRLQRYQQESIIPHIFQEKVLGLGNPGDRRLYEVKMPLWYIKKHRWDGGDEDLTFCEMEYDAELGGRFSIDEGLRMF